MGMIIGTAGHVDHGKTTLIKALTGVDTDRLIEEKKRGITIELGFAHLTLPNGQRCGIVDVPGHEKFVKNMLLGAGSIDLALFVVAADEGIMPQSKEHLEILQLLGVRQGVVVLTKCDAVEKDWLELAISDIESGVKGSFLENAAIFPVSARTGQGLDELKAHLFRVLSEEAVKNKAEARLPIDRVFSVDGFGTVVTGTLIEGEISVGDELVIHPTMQKAKVRSLQMHSVAVEKADSGNRVAVNLAGVKTEEIVRGCTLAAGGSLTNSDVVDVRLFAAKNTKRKIKNNSLLHFHHGASEVEVRVTLVGQNELCAGESCFAQLRSENPIFAKAGDRFVVRFISPLETVGGGVIIDPTAQKRDRNSSETLRLFDDRESEDAPRKLYGFIASKSKKLVPLSSIQRSIFYGKEAEFNAALADLVSQKQVFLVKNSAISKEYLEILSGKCRAVLQEFHKNNPLLEGMKKDEIKSKALRGVSAADEVLAVLDGQKTVKIKDGLVALSDFKVEFSQSLSRLSQQIEAEIKGGGFAPLGLEELAAASGKSAKEFRQALDFLTASGTLIVLQQGMAIHQEYYQKAVEIVRELGDGKEFSLSEFRDKIASSRKYALALLENFDNKNITKKLADSRTLANKK